MGMRPRLKGSRRAELAVFDVVLFVPLMIVALIFLQSALSVQTSTSQEVTNGSQYAGEALSALLTSTAPSAEAAVGQPAQNQSLQDWSIGNLILLDVYSSSCNTITQANLDRPGWVGAVIESQASTVSFGTVAGVSSSLFSDYYLQFNGTAEPGAHCGTPTPVNVIMGEKPSLNATDVFTSNKVLIPPALPGEGGVEVVLGLWGQS